MLHLLLIFLTVVYAIVCLLLILAVLMQRSKQDGLGAAFGGGITDSMFGAQTSSVLVKATSWLTAMFFILAIVLAHFYGKTNAGESAIQQQIRAESAVVPAPVPTPVPASTPVNPAPVGTKPVPVPASVPSSK